MDQYAIPIVNGALPRPNGGTLQGVFLDPFFANLLAKVGVGGDIFIFPASLEDESLYPVGIFARIEDLWTATVAPYSNAVALYARVIGRDTYKARSFHFTGDAFLAQGLERLDHGELRERGYPTISGAGWHPTGGYTTFGADRTDVEITIYGFDLETGRDVAMVGHLGQEIEPEIAHTVEHAIIRSLKSFGLCTPKTLRECMIRETEELKWSVEIGIAKRMPEVFGVTRSGICGNPLTQMASYYLSEEFKNQIKSGGDLLESITKARKKTVSKVTNEMGISSQRGRRELQGLKKGMFHDDTPVEMQVLRRVIMKFPVNPWD